MKWNLHSHLVMNNCIPWNIIVGDVFTFNPVHDVFLHPVGAQNILDGRTVAQ